jgi:hypothetical protein
VVIVYKQSVIKKKKGSVMTDKRNWNGIRATGKSIAGKDSEEVINSFGESLI